MMSRRKFLYLASISGSGLLGRSLVGRRIIGNTIKQSSLKEFIVNEQCAVKIVWQVRVDGRDWMCTGSVDEIENLRLLPEIAVYLASRQIGGCTPLYRLHCGQEYGGDHIVTTISSRDACSNDGLLGYAWSEENRPEGTEELWIAEINGDSLLTAASDKRFNQLSNIQHTGLHAYPRFMEDWDLEAVTGPEITIKSSRAAGGAIESLTWNGVEFVDNADVGRLIQGSLNLSDHGLPTQGGVITEWRRGVRFFHGAPTLMLKTWNNVQESISVPVEWNANEYDWTDKIELPGSLVLYPNWRFGKKVEISPQISLGNEFDHVLRGLVKYTSYVQFTRGFPVSTDILFECPAAFLKKDFGKLYLFDASKSDTNLGTKELHTPLNEHPHLDSFPGGGIIAANSAHTHALGLFALSKEAGGAVDYYNVSPRTDVTKLNLGVALHGPLSSEKHSVESYIICGSLDDVRVAMRRLFMTLGKMK